MFEKIPLTLYVTSNAPQEAAKLIKDKYNVTPASYEQLFYYLNAALKQDGEDFLKELAMIHPDREIVLETAPAPVVTPVVNETKSSASGMTFSCKDKTSSATGDNSDSTTTTTPVTTPVGFTFDMKKELPFIAAGALFVTGLILLVKTL